MFGRGRPTRVYVGASQTAGGCAGRTLLLIVIVIIVLAMASH